MNKYKIELNQEGTCELVIYCFKCKAIRQLNPQMIALSLATNVSVWDVYEYILTVKCKDCQEEIKLES